MGQVFGQVPGQLVVDADAALGVHSDDEGQVRHVVLVVRNVKNDIIVQIGAGRVRHAPVPLLRTSIRFVGKPTFNN